MKCNSKNSLWYAGLVVAAGTGAAHADTLYDALYSNQHYSYQSTLTVSTIGGIDLIGESLDSQSADDFSLASDTAITTVTFDMTTEVVSSATSLPDSVLVEFFADMGGVPATAPAAAATFTSFPVLTELEGTWLPIYRIELDMSSEGIVLGAGTWWVSFTASADDNIYYPLACLAEIHQTGALIHARDSGIAHATGFAGYYGSTSWIPYPFSGRGDLAMKIDGYAVPAPGAMALLGLGGLGATRRRR